MNSPEGSPETELRHTVEGFIASVDRVDVTAVEAIYHPDFCCVRVADSGGFVNLTRVQMVAFLNRAASLLASAGQSAPHPAIPTRETTIHHAEVTGDTGYVLLTRVKDLGSGWEPLFYTLVWQKQEGKWRLLREFVHQKTAPRW